VQLQFRGAEGHHIQWGNHGQRVRQEWFARGDAEEGRPGRQESTKTFGKLLDEMKQNFQIQLSEEFASHACAKRPLVKGAKLSS
jgi:hypothetical protein